MSINFDEEMTAEAKGFVEELFDEKIAAMDNKTILLNKMELRQKEMSELANKAKQPVSAEINAVGDIKTFMDGTKYRLEQTGWKKLDPTDI